MPPWHLLRPRHRRHLPLVRPQQPHRIHLERHRDLREHVHGRRRFAAEDAPDVRPADARRFGELRRGHATPRGELADASPDSGADLLWRGHVGHDGSVARPGSMFTFSNMSVRKSEQNGLE